MTDLMYDGPDTGTTLILAHGAGAPMDHPFLNTLTANLVEHGVRVVRFEFPYMALRRQDGKRRGPNPARILEQTWREIVAQVHEPGTPLCIGGKSMGGRIASHVADELGAARLVCLGYPFHPPGKPERLRTAHLEDISTPTLILQGERDTFGTKAEVETYNLSDNIEVSWLTDGDHSFKPRKRAPVTLEENLAHAATQIAAFLQET